MTKLYYKFSRTLSTFLGTLILLFWFIPESQAQTYCIPIYTDGCSWGDDISNVTLEGETITLNNSTTACSANAYQDYTSLAHPDLAPGNTYTISISTGYSSPSFEDVRAWIDYNNNGIFEATETIANTNGNGMDLGTVSYDFTVPAGTPAGDYRLRVRLVYSSSSIDPCASDYYGETEDYTVTVISLSPCAGAPSAGTTIPDFDICALTPFNISTLNASAPAAGLDSKWQSSPEGANNWTDIAGAISVNYTVTAGITAATDYRYIRTCTNSNLSDTSDVLSVTLSPGTSCYCDPVYNWGCSNGARVDGVTTTFGLTNISNTGTGCTDLDATGYSDYSATHSASAAHSTMMNVKVDVGNYAGGVKVWIDWNQNGIFEASEMVAESPATIPQGSFYQTDFMVPPTAVLGDTKMRVRVMESSTVFDPCTVGGYGEAEDYGFTVLQGTACSGMPVIDTIQGPNEICALTAFTLTMDPILMTDVDYLWQESPLGANNWTAVTGGTSFTHTFVNGITTDTDYRLIVTCTNSNLSDTTDVHGVTIAPGTSCYCDPVYNWGCGIGAQVDGVTTTFGLTNISNTGTGCNELDATGYTDFSATHSASAAHSTQMTVKVDVANYSGGVKVWIDWNQNGIFEPSELIGESTSTISPGNFYQTNFMVPATAATGTTKMRVRVAESTTVFDPCSVGGYGEAEDYAFEVIALQDCSTVSTPSGWDIVFNKDSVCLVGDISMTINEQIYASNLTYLFQQSTDGVNWTDIGSASLSPEASVNDVDEETQFRVIWLCNNVGIDTAVGTVYVVDPQIATTTDGSRCGSGTVTLSATTLSGGEIRWYDDNLGTNLLGTGNDFITPFLTNSTTYWTAAGLGGSGNNDTLHTLSSAGNGCGGGAMFNLTATDDLQIDSLTALATGSGSEVKVYYREGGYVGFNQNAAAWTLHETINMNYTTGNISIPLTNPLELTANTTYGIYVFYNASYTNGTPANSTYSNADLLFEGGDGLCSEFGGVNVGRIFNGTIHYSMVGCESDLVAVEAVVNDNPVVSLGGNLAACEGHVFTLDAGPGFDSYLWSDNSTGQTLDVTSSGVYSVEISLGTCFATDSVDVVFYDAPVPMLDATMVACDGDIVELDAGNASPTTEYTWSTGDTTQSIYVEDPGTYTVNIFNGACDIDDEVVVTFIEQSTGQSIHNTELGERLFQFYVVNPVNVENYFWDFGDGHTSTEAQPIHEYSSFGSFDVSVNLSQESCFDGDSLMRHIVVRSVDIDELVKADNYVKLYPNPASNVVTIELEEALQMKSVMIQDITGRVIMERQFENVTSEVNISTQPLASGLYQVVINTNEGRFVRKLEIIK